MLSLTRTIPGRLLLLVAALTLPVAAFTIFLVLQHARAEQDGYAAQSTQIAGFVTRIIDDELARHASLLSGLSASSQLRDGQFAAFQDEAEKLVAGSDRIIVLRDLGARQIVNTAVPFGQPLPPAVPMSPDEQLAFKTGTMVVGNSYRSPIGGELRIPVALPIAVGAETLVLAVTLPATHFADILQDATPPGWVLTLGDANGIIVARSLDNEKYAGQPALPAYLDRATGDSGSFRIAGFGGRMLLTGYERSPASGWLIGANIPVDVVEAPLWGGLGTILLGGALAAGIAALISAAFIRRFKSASQALLQQVRSGPGAAPPAGTTGLEEFDQVITALATARGLQAEAEGSLRARTQELSVVLDTVPAAVWFTYDPKVKEVTRNAHATQLLRLGHDNRASIGSGQLAHFQVFRNDVLCQPADLPLQRAFNGENVRDEEYQFRFSDGTELTLLTSAEPLHDIAGKVIGAVSVSVDITDRKRSETHQKLLMNELNHRVKNSLATVQSVARRSLRTASSLTDAERSLSTRLVAIARAYDVLTRQNWQGADVKASFEGIQNAYGLGRIAIEGPEFRLSPANSVTLSLVAHELAVNATKYGALSNESGRIHVQWQVVEEKDVSVLRVTWRESGGPPVNTPVRTGFGTDLLQRLHDSEGMRHSIDFRPDGVVCVFSLSQERTIGTAPTTAVEEA